MLIVFLYLAIVSQRNLWWVATTRYVCNSNHSTSIFHIISISFDDASITPVDGQPRTHYHLSRTYFVFLLFSYFRVLSPRTHFLFVNMPKAAKNSKLGRVARRLAAGHPLPLSITKDVGRGQQEEEPDAPGKQDLSRGQKRRLAKREQYVKREKMILTSLKLKSQEEQKGRIDGLDAIREALVGTTRDAGKVEKKEPVNTPTHKSNKGKQRLLAEEVHHMGLVSFSFCVVCILSSEDC